MLWNKKHISPVSIKESADTLPAGICFYEQSGLVRLINTEMNRLCVLATGKALLDCAIFWRKVSQGEIEENCLPLQTGEKPIIEYPDGKVVSFKRYLHEIDGKIVYEIVAANVTERYRLTKELEQKLDELKAVNKRLVAYGDNVVELTKEKEFYRLQCKRKPIRVRRGRGIRLRFVEGCRRFRKQVSCAHHKLYALLM